MTREEILENIKMLAKSQGYYGRLLRAIEEDETILDTLEEQNFNDVVDMVLFFRKLRLKMSEEANFEMKKFEGRLGIRSLIFKVRDLGSYQVGLRGFIVQCHNSGLNLHDVAVMLFNCSDYIELITVYESNGILKVLVRDSYQGDLDKEFFDKLTDRFIEEEVRYVTFETLQNYITDSISNIEYDRTRFTNFFVAR